MKSESEIRARREGKAARRKQRRREMTPEQVIEKEIDRFERISFGAKQLRRMAEPIVEQSKQREIERNIVEDGHQPDIR